MNAVVSVRTCQSMIGDLGTYSDVEEAFVDVGSTYPDCDDQIFRLTGYLKFTDSNRLS